MSWLKPKARQPQLYVGEDVEWQTKVISFVGDDRGIVGFLFLTDRRVVYEYFGTRKSFQRHYEFGRSDCRSIERDRHNWGVSPASAVWEQVIFHLADDRSMRFGMRLADNKVSYLNNQLDLS